MEDLIACKVSLLDRIGLLGDMISEARDHLSGLEDQRNNLISENISLDLDIIRDNIINK